jgi:acyl phosphate:glycerol-3-phosphate acyltransferase
MIITLCVLVAIIGYLSGSVPFGLIVGRFATGRDIRNVGSGKIGTTNVLRMAGKKAAVLVLLLDIAKGALPVLLAGLIFSSSRLTGQAVTVEWMVRGAQVIAAITAIFGHNWSVFLRFKGGRGVATFLGGLLALYWPAAILAGAVMIIVGAISKYMSLGSIVGSVAAFIMLIAMYFFNSYSIDYLFYTMYAMLCASFIILMHRDNVGRLISGTERKLGDKTKAGNTK